ncbi:YraN family protein [Polynucleobacter sp. IMCC 30228]|uniref:YraN family protein n=1 Tax=Polynucleobacter sp. IMCC 30228 TaxID=2781011 RepID=UPI00351CC93B
MHIHNIGKKAEAAAKEYLQCAGLNFVTLNYRCRMGEIDLIMRDQATLVFVEVRARSSSNWGGALASINASKQNKIYKTAQYYLQSHYRAKDYPSCRFDVIAIKGDQLEWLKAAF